jgi:hypothetical protein
MQPKYNSIDKLTGDFIIAALSGTSLSGFILINASRTAAKEYAGIFRASAQPETAAA